MSRQRDGNCLEGSGNTLKDFKQRIVVRSAFGKLLLSALCGMEWRGTRLETQSVWGSG